MASQKVEVEISYPLTKTQFLDQDRVHSDVEPPVADVLQHDQLFDGTKIRVNLLKEHFRREGRITTDDIFYIVETATDLIAREPNLLTVPAPVTGKCHPLCVCVGVLVCMCVWVGGWFGCVCNYFRLENFNI